MLNKTSPENIDSLQILLQNSNTNNIK